jgi:hypothetical protein
VFDPLTVSVSLVDGFFETLQGILFFSLDRVDAGDVIEKLRILGIYLE